jgi:hypothetical protein
MKRFVRAASCVLLALLVAGSVARGWADQPDEKKRHTETGGGFSFIPPDGWTVKEFPGLKFKIAVGPAAAEFAPNINVVDEADDGKLDDYVKRNVAALQKVFKKGRLVKQEQFKTAAGLESARVIFEHEQQGKLLRQTFYFFDKGKTKFVVTCTALAEGGEKLDPVFEASLKTFRI